jgi:hypothetical protein
LRLSFVGRIAGNRVAGNEEWETSGELTAVAGEQVDLEDLEDFEVLTADCSVWISGGVPSLNLYLKKSWRFDSLFLLSFHTTTSQTTGTLLKDLPVPDLYHISYDTVK